MSNENRNVAENGLTLGIAVLALFVIFAVGLPRWLGGDSSEPIDLPERIGEAGNLYTLDTSPEAETMLDATQSTARESVDDTAAVGLYVKGEDRVVVQAVRESGNAPFAPMTTSYSTVDGATCMFYEGTTPISVCQAGTEQLTVQVTSFTSTEDAAKFANQLVDELA